MERSRAPGAAFGSARRGKRSPRRALPCGALRRGAQSRRSGSAKEGTDPSIFVGHPENAEKEGTDPSPGVGTGLSFVRYLMLAAAILVGSWALLKAIHALLPAFSLSLAKPLVDLALFFVSFTVQRHFVFAH